MTRFALLALAVSLPLSASAQTKDAPKPAAAEQARAVMPAASMTLPDTLRPGDLTIVAPTAGEVSYTVRLLAPMQQEIGTLTETTAIDGDVITRTSVVAVPMAGQNETTVTTVDAATWTVRSVSMDGTTAVGNLTFADGRVTGTSGVMQNPGDALDPKPVDEAAPDALFGGGWPYVLARSLPLTAGGVYHIQTYSPRDGVTTERLTMLGEQSVKPTGGAAVTLAAMEVFDGEQTMTHFVDPATKNIMMVRFSPQPGVEVEFVRN